MAEEKKEKKDVKKETEVKAEEKEEKKIEKKETPKAKTEKPVPEPESQEEVEIPTEFADLVKQIEKMSVLDLSRLVKILEKKFHVSATPMMSAQPAAAGAGAASAEGDEEEKSSYDVVLTGIGDQKIQVIKVLRDLTDKGLKDSKDLADQAAKEPQVLKEGVKKDEAEDMKKKLEEAGAGVELK